MDRVETPPSRWFEKNVVGNNGGRDIKPPEESVEDQEPLIIHDFKFYAKNRPDEEETLLGDNWLFRGGWGAVIGPTGQGKTSFSIQAAACWALGRPFLGIVPSGEHRIMIVQIENGALDLHEMASGVVEELGLSEDELCSLTNRLSIVTPNLPTPELFGDDGSIAKQIIEWEPDLLMIDSLYKWLRKGTAADPEGVVDFIDRKLLPLCRKVKCGALISHHMGRAEVERLDEGKSTRMTDYYAGAGGMFVADSARATLLLVPGEEKGEYTLRAVKRGTRIGWRDDEGVKVYQKPIAWAEGHIGWRELDERSVQSEHDERKRAKQRAKNARYEDHVLWAFDQVSGDEEWVERQLVEDKCGSTEGPIPEGIKRTKALEVMRQMVGDGLLRQEERKNKKNRKAAHLNKV